MKYILRPVVMIILTLIWCVASFIGWVLLNTAYLIWYFNFKHYESFPAILDTLPDGSKCFYVSSHDEYGKAVDGRLSQKWCYYMTFKDSLIGNKVVKTFLIDPREV